MLGEVRRCTTDKSKDSMGKQVFCNSLILLGAPGSEFWCEPKSDYL